jgi:hypothetical protein
MELNKYQIKFELMRLQKLKNELIDNELADKVKELTRQIFTKRQELVEDELEQMLILWVQEIKAIAKES